MMPETCEHYAQLNRLYSLMIRRATARSHRPEAHLRDLDVTRFSKP
jgi:hypothetical protein